MRAGKPVVVHGDGTSLWTLTHASDFAKALVGLFGLPQAIGDSFTITSDEYLPWNRIYEIFAEAAGAPAPQLVHIACRHHRSRGTGARTFASWGQVPFVGLRQQQSQGVGPRIHLHGSVRTRRAADPQLVRRESGSADSQ